MDILEIEIKAYCNDHTGVKKEITAIGAKFISMENESDVYFNHPSKDFKKTDEAFRIRQVGDNIILTYKGPKMSSKAKTRIEEEVKIDNFEMMKSILKRLGFVESGTVNKIREIYSFNDIEICLDQVDGLGNFVELEKKDTDKEKVEKELFSLAQKIGLNKFETKSYLELLTGPNS